MAYRRDRRVVVEDRNPMWAIIAVLVILLILFFAWMFFRNNDLRGEDEGRRTNTEERQDQPEGNIQIPGEDDTQAPGSDTPTTEDDPTAGNEPTTGPTSGDVPPGGGTPAGSG